jgi:hypothetical protein
MSDDYRDHLDAMDHNAVHAWLSRQDKLNSTVTFDILKSVFGEDIIDDSLSGRALLSDAEARLKKSTPQVAKSTMPKATPSQNPTNIQISPAPQKTIGPISTGPVQVKHSAEHSPFTDPKEYLPNIAPVLLYLLIWLSLSGIMISEGIASSLAFAIGLGFAAIVPALMPPHPVHRPLAGVSAVGWFVVILANIMSLDPGIATGPIVALANTGVLVSTNFLLLTVGVAVFADPPKYQMWTRRIANNFTAISLAILLLALVNSALDGTLFLASITGTIAGLWGISVLGQSRPINIRVISDQISIALISMALISLLISWEGNDFIILLAGILFLGLALLGPNLKNNSLGDMLLAGSAIGLIGLSAIASQQGDSFFGLFTHLLLALVTVSQMELRFREINKADAVIERILPPEESSTTSDEHEVESDIAILGFQGAGKTSFLGALWLVLDHHLTRDLWYGTMLNKNRPFAFNTGDMKQLLKENLNTGDQRMMEQFDDKEIVKEYLSHRYAPKTMKEEFENDILPPIEKGFPFDTNATRATRTFLNTFTSELTKRDLKTRNLADATAQASDQLSMTLTFPAELTETFPTFFGMGSKSKTKKCIVRHRIHSMDVPGEEVQNTVNFMDGKRIRSSSIDSLLNQIMNRTEEFGDYRYGIEYIVKMTAKYKHVLFIVDADELTRADRTNDSPVGAFLRLADSLSQLKGSSLRKITVLLNKSDELLGRGEQQNRTMPNGGLDRWDDILNQEIAYKTLEEAVGPAILNLINIPIEVYFTCTLGGLIAKEDNTFAPTFPMVPINVIEPSLRTMTRRE